MSNWMRWLVAPASRSMRYTTSAVWRTSQQNSSGSRRAPVYRKLPSGENCTCAQGRRCSLLLVGLAYYFLNAIYNTMLENITLYT